MHANLPGSLWLANTGDAELSGQGQNHFSHHRQQASQGDKGWPPVFYCRSGCWLGWNPLKHAQPLVLP